jgi:hypothetical protein
MELVACEAAEFMHVLLRRFSGDGWGRAVGGGVLVVSSLRKSWVLEDSSNMGSAPKPNEMLFKFQSGVFASGPGMILATLSRSFLCLRFLWQFGSEHVVHANKALLDSFVIASIVSSEPAARLLNSHVAKFVDCLRSMR